jgi:hypothetical protein
VVARSDARRLSFLGHILSQKALAPVAAWRDNFTLVERI